MNRKLRLKEKCQKFNFVFVHDVVVPSSGCSFKSSIYDGAIEQNSNPGYKITHQRLPIFDNMSII